MDKELENSEESEDIKLGAIEIGTFNLQLSTLKKGMEESKIWSSITMAVIAMAYPNSYRRLDLNNEEMLKRLEKETGLKIDYAYLELEKARKPFLVQPNGFKDKIDTVVVSSGKKITKKQLKSDAKREKIQGKIDALKKKHGAIKNKKCDRAVKLNAQIEELEIKRDRT